MGIQTAEPDIHNKQIARGGKRKLKAALLFGGVPLLLLSGFVLWTHLFGDILSGVDFSDAYLDRNGTLLHLFLTEDDKYRIRKPLSDFPPQLVEAVLLQEDRYFFAHPGVNPGALFRAGWETYIRKNRRMGASTITMQVARLKYRLYTRNIPGKLAQIARALYLELCFTKQEILEAYLNLAPCGGNIEGFGAASWYYFGERAENLELSQILLLAVIPQDPVSRSPRKNHIPGELADARKTLFDSWCAIHSESADLESEIALVPQLVCRVPARAPHLTSWLRTVGTPRARQAPYGELRTTVDLSLQTLCEKTLARYIEQNRSFGVQNGAILLADWTSREVLASVGSADFFGSDIQGQVDGTRAKRSPGSTLKPFIYALALEQGLIHSETMLKDTPVSFNEYTPDNFGSDFRGPVHAGDALVDSRNIPAITLARDIHEPDLYDFLKKAEISGLKERDHYGLSIVLGSAEVTMTELVRLYAMLANGGVGLPLRYLCVPDGDRQGARELTPASAFIVRKMLELNAPPWDGKPSTARDIPVAFKTGTSIGFKDCWSVAIFDRYVLCVWLGNFNGQGNNSFQGRTMATPLLFNILNAMLAAMPPGAQLPPPAIPDTVERIPVCAVSGGLPGPECAETMPAWFIPGVSPIAKCHIHRTVWVDSRTGYRTDPGPGKFRIPVVREFWPTDLLELFEKAGLPRLTPPEWPPEDSRFDTRGQGFPPEILSPLANTDYIIRAGDDKRTNLVLSAASDADSTELFWFSGSAFIGRAKPGEKILWKPEPGRYTLTVTDSKGRADSIALRVVPGE